MEDDDVGTAMITVEEISKEEEKSSQIRSFVRAWARRSTKIDFQVVNQSLGQVLNTTKHLVKCAKCDNAGLMIAWNILNPKADCCSSSSSSFGAKNVDKLPTVVKHASFVMSITSMSVLNHLLQKSRE